MHCRVLEDYFQGLHHNISEIAGCCLEIRDAIQLCKPIKTIKTSN